MYSRQAFVSKMRSYLGASRGDINHKHIVDTYNSHLPLARGYKLTYKDAWCAATVSAASIECGYTKIIPTECSCTRMITILKALGEWTGNDNYTPKPGDLIFYNWNAKTEAQDVDGLANHVGVVESVANGKITVIEGNKNGKCARLTIKIGWKYIHSFGLPKFDEDEAPKAPETPKTSEAVYVKPRLGEGLYSIAKRSGITFEEITRLNPDIKPPKYVVRFGKKVRVK